MESPRGRTLLLSGPIVGADPNSSRDVSVAQIDSRGLLKVTRNEKLFNADSPGFATSSLGLRGYDVGPDGQRLIVQTIGLERMPTIALIEDLGAWMRAKQQ